MKAGGLDVVRALSGIEHGAGRPAPSRTVRRYRSTVSRRFLARRSPLVPAH
jgi:hypothetical protein